MRATILRWFITEVEEVDVREVGKTGFVCGGKALHLDIGVVEMDVEVRRARQYVNSDGRSAARMPMEEEANGVE